MTKPNGRARPEIAMTVEGYTLNEILLNARLLLHSKIVPVGNELVDSVAAPPLAAIGSSRQLPYRKRRRTSKHLAGGVHLDDGDVGRRHHHGIIWSSRKAACLPRQDPPMRAVIIENLVVDIR